MSVILASEQEKIFEKQRENLRNKGTWEYYRSTSIVQVVHKARELGWGENKVQVKSYMNGDIEEFHIEPYEYDCNCPSVLKFDDFFDQPEHTK